MNRIYQGQITSVEKIDQESGVSQRLAEKSWRKALWEHHSVFQDAVNYYIVALLGMATSKENLSEENPFLKRTRSQVTKNSEDQIWYSFRRKGTTRKGLQESLSRTIKLERKNLAPTDYFHFILHGNVPEAKVSQREIKILDLAVRELFKEIKIGSNAIQRAGVDMWPRFCDPEFTGDYPNSEHQLHRARNEPRLHSELHRLDRKELRKFADELDLGWIDNLYRDKEPYKGAKARAQLHEAINFFGEPEAVKKPRVASFLKNPENNADGELLKITDEISQIPDGELPEIPRNRSAAKEKTRAVLLFKYFPNLFTWSLLKTVFPLDHQAPVPASSNLLDEEIRKLEDDPIKLARKDRGYIFPAYPYRQFLDGDSISPYWKGFNIAAFKEALKALHQIDVKTKEREKDCERLKKKIACMNNEQEWMPVAEQEAQEDTLPCLAGDPRIERLEAILAEDLSQSYDMADGDTRPYGLRFRTIREFDELRERWCRTVANSAYSKALEQRLLQQLKEYQKEKSSSIGSVFLFKKLLEQENWIIWQEPTPEDLKKWQLDIGLKPGANLEFSDNPMKDLAKKYQIDEKIKRLSQPVQLTPADPIHSPRHYWFSDDPSFKKQGFGHQKDRHSIRVFVVVLKPDGVFQEEVMDLHYSAPRLVRDGLDSGVKKTLDDALFSQPMMKGIENTEPLMQTGNFAVSMMPKKNSRTNGKRFLLNFSPTIDTEELIKRLGKKSRWQGQFVTNRDKKNFYLRWPSIQGGRKPEGGWWWDRPNSPFSCLSIDLGQRYSGSICPSQGGMSTI